MNKRIIEGIAELKRGRVVLIYHPGEKETAMAVAAEKINLKIMEVMKENASSDIGVSLEHELAKKLGLFFSPDTLSILPKEFFPTKEKKIKSFPILLDSVRRKTGSSHKDKLLLIQDIVSLLKKEQYNRLKDITIYPGHLRFFVASEELLNKRKGHTELSIALAKFAKMYPMVIMCSMRDRKNGGMLAKNKAMVYAKENNLIFLTQEDIVKEFDKIKE